MEGHRDLVIGSNERSWFVDVSFDNFGKTIRPEVVKLAKKSCFHIRYIKNIQKKNIPLRVWGRLGPARVSQRAFDI